MVAECSPGAVPLPPPPRGGASPDPQVIAAVVQALITGDPAAAEALLEPMRARFVNDGDVLNLSGIAAGLLGDPQRAVGLTRAAVAADPQSGLFHANHGAALAAAGQPLEAARALETSLQLRPDHAGTRRNLGLALAQLGRGAQALPMLFQARDMAPDDPETHLALARCLREAGSRAAACEAAAAALALDPPPLMAEEARFLLADTGGAMPQRAPAGYVRHLFDAYAPIFDQHLREVLDYRTPEVLAELLAESGAETSGASDVLDLGCGTGLSGVALKPFAGRITGIDLSPRMLERAAATGAYGALIEGELPTCLDTLPDAGFDIAMAADVMIYLGAPEPILEALGRLLRPGGRVALSLEISDAGRAMEVSDSLRYRHDPATFLAAAEAAGFRTVVRREEVLRRERGTPVPGLLVVLARGRA